MEYVKEKFSNAFNLNYNTIKSDQNLNCICYEETKNLLIISAYSSLTMIKGCLVIDKTQEIKIIKFSPQVPDIRDWKLKNKQFFSLFMGIYTYKTKNYLVFAKKVQLVPFPKKGLDIFEIKSVTVISLENNQTCERREQEFNKVMKQGFYFSYDFDMTRPFNLENISSFRKRKEPNWLYFVNRGMQKCLFGKKSEKWIIPIVFGNIGGNTLNF